MRTIIALLFLSVIPQTLDACGHCGYSYCRGCYVRKVNRIVKVIPPVIVKQPDVLVVQNNYPQPLVGQGATGYAGANFASFQQGQLQFFDRGAYLSQRMELARAMSANLSLDFNQQTVLAERFATLEAPAIERLAAGQAGAMVLQAAGLDVRGQATGTRSAVVVSHDEYGNIQVKPLNEQQADAAYQRYEDVERNQQQGGNGQLPQGEGSSLVTQYCGKCHGEAVASPKGGFYLGSSPEVVDVMRREWFKITYRVTTEDANMVMPPPEAPQPSREQKGQILNELEQRILSQGDRS